MKKSKSKTIGELLKNQPPVPLREATHVLRGGRVVKLPAKKA